MDPKHTSPWLHELAIERPHFRLEKDADCDIAIVGAGIAGISTAYEVLKHTTGSVVLVDAGRVAHGATGHNAGQVVTYFERPMADIARVFGVHMAVSGQVAVESAWDQLEAMRADCGLRTPLHTCKGYMGFSTMEKVLAYLEEKDLRAQAGLPEEPMLFSVNPALKREIPEHLQRHVLDVPHSVILTGLETQNPDFFALGREHMGCMNSACFCEELLGWMLANHGGRLIVAEKLPVTEVRVGDGTATLKTTGPTVTAKRVVLCTNGFENFSIRNLAGPDIDTKFHANVWGYIGYMAGYVDGPGRDAAAISYRGKTEYRRQDDGLEPYTYLTRRPYECPEKECNSLLCIGGPERELPDCATYDRSSPFPADIEEQLDRDLRRCYHNMSGGASRTFTWHGLMGYTPNKLRRIGYEPLNHTLLYNLGCNGVGILPSVYGGKRIAQLLSGKKLPASIFDPDKGSL